MVLIDESTGRLRPITRWQGGLHQVSSGEKSVAAGVATGVAAGVATGVATGVVEEGLSFMNNATMVILVKHSSQAVEAKEGVRIKQETQPTAQITFQVQCVRGLWHIESPLQQ